MVQIFLSIEWTTLNSIYVIFIEDVHMYMYFVHCLIKDQSKLLYITPLLRSINATYWLQHMFIHLFIYLFFFTNYE